MPLRLPRVIVGPRGVKECPDGILTDVEVQRLIALEAGSTAARWTIERCLPLEGRRWAVGRRVAGLGLWRIVTAQDVDRVGGHPAWLWTADDWFDPELGPDEPARAPAALPLRNLVRFAAPLGGRDRRTIKALAAVVAALRAGDRPVAVVVPEELLSSASHPARWFALALLTVLPPIHRDAMSVMVGEPSPASGDARVALTAVAAPGYVPIDVMSPPDEGDDLVAYYLRNRLYDDDPEALEAAAYLYDSDGSDHDRWGDGIAALIRDGMPGVSEVTDDLLAADPERAVRALTARLRAGAPLDEALLECLIAVTLQTRDPRPWSTLWSRSAVQRADAVDALLAAGHDLRPTGPLVRILGALYPRGAPLGDWVPSLLHWLHQGAAPDVVVEVLQTTLLEWPMTATGPTRASIWSEVVVALVELGHDEEAMDALVGPVASELASAGHGRALVASWAAVPATFRDPERMRSLVGLLHGSAEGGTAVAELFRHVRGHLDEAGALVRAWIELEGEALTPDDPLLVEIHGTDYLQEATDAWLGRNHDDPRQQLLALAGAPPALGSLVERARATLGPAVHASVFPDDELAAATERIAGWADASAIWGWVAVSAAGPGVYDDDTIDATVVEFAGAEVDGATMGLAAAAVRGLGAAPVWEPLELARWIVRLALMPTDPARSAALAVALSQGIAQREDAVTVMTNICGMLFDLPVDHPALYLLLDQLLETAWQGGPPAELIEAMPLERVPDDLRGMWLSLGNR